MDQQRRMDSGELKRTKNWWPNTKPQILWT